MLKFYFYDKGRDETIILMAESIKDAQEQLDQFGLDEAYRREWVELVDFNRE